MSEQRERLYFLSILALGIVMSIAISYLNDDIFRTKLTQWGDDAGQYNATALSLIHNGSFHDARSLFFGRWQKGPGYPIFLAVVYRVFGEYPLSAWLMHVVLWLASLFLLWRIGRRFLRKEDALLPPLLLALYWGAAVYVISINSDLIALFLVLLYTWAFFSYGDSSSLPLALVQGFTLGYLVLTKPVMLYAVPFLFLLFLIHARPLRARKVLHVVLLFTITMTMIGAWSFYNHSLMGTYQLGSGALTLMHRADDVNLSSARISAFIIASAFGDFIADKLYPGYATGAEPFTWEADQREKAYWAQQLPDKTNEYELQQEQYKIAYSLIQQHPIKFFLTGFIYILRLNSPVNHRGVELIHTFVGTKVRIPDILKIVAMLFARLIWFLFLGLVLYGFRQVARNWFLFLPILFFILYVNSVYALVSHAEARYIVPILPFYFLLATIAFRLLRKQEN